ncbi:hypothetical protein AB0H43_37275 [Hamadaea sp. NPDC050747]|uniref:hypothetical protein n=1 Tax=Hamadaea sp. NPDC050747 TaxID=3155789 RepID=UPI0033F06D32
MRGQLSGRSLEGRTRSAQCGEDVELTLAETVPVIDDGQLLGQLGGEAVQPPDDAPPSRVIIASPMLFERAFRRPKQRG